MNNAEAVHKLLKKRKRASSVDIYDLTGVWRVSDAIHKLRRYAKICTVMMTGLNRNGQSVRYAMYYLDK